MPIPTPWIRAPESPARTYLQGFGSGAQVAESNARLAMAEQELEAQRQRADQQARLQESQLAVAKAYHDATISMEQQRIREQQKANEMKWLQTGRQWAEQQGYLKDIQEGNMSAAEAASRHPGMFGTGAGLAQVVSAAQRSNVPLETQVVGGETFYRTPEGWQHISKGMAEAQPTLYAKGVVSSIQTTVRQKEAWLMENPKAKESERVSVQNTILQEKQRANRLAKEGNLSIPFPEVEGQGRDWSTARQIGRFKVIQE